MSQLNPIGIDTTTGQQKVYESSTDNFPGISTLNNYVTVRSLSDLPTPVANVISLVANTTYQINGIIALLGNQIKIADSVLIVGSNKYTDGFTATHANPMFIDSGVTCNFIMRYTVITNSTASSSVFLFTGGGRTDVRFNRFISCTSLGNVDGNLEFNFYNNYINNCSNGILINAINELQVWDNHFDNNISTQTCITIGVTIFSSIVISRNIFEAAATQTCLNISTSVSVTSAILSLNIFKGAGTYLTGITNTQSFWYFADNTNIANSVKQIWADPWSIAPVAVTVPTAAACTVVTVTTVTGEIALSYSGTADQNASISFRVPKDYFSGGSIRLAFAASTTVAAVNVVIAPIFTIKALGSTINTITETPTPQTIASGTAFVSQQTAAFTIASGLAADTLIIVRMTRPATNAGDTYTGALLGLGIIFEYNAK